MVDSRAPHFTGNTAAFPGMLIPSQLWLGCGSVSKNEIITKRPFHNHFTKVSNGEPSVCLVLSSALTAAWLRHEDEILKTLLLAGEPDPESIPNAHLMGYI